MIVILGTIRLPPENLEAARAAMSAMVQASRAEPGCLDYAYAEDVLQPGLVRVIERWTDQASLDAHAASAHLKAWRAAWPSLSISDRRLFAYEAGEPKPI